MMMMMIIRLHHAAHKPNPRRLQRQRRHLIKEGSPFYLWPEEGLHSGGPGWRSHRSRGLALRDTRSFTQQRVASRTHLETSRKGCVTRAFVALQSLHASAQRGSESCSIAASV